MQITMWQSREAQSSGGQNSCSASIVLQPEGLESLGEEIELSGGGASALRAGGPKVQILASPGRAGK